jgi:UDP-N-acetyl-D-galactosamine dehydrogenase
MKRRIAVIGLGYVGLPVAVAFARRFPGTIGFDQSEKRIHALRAGVDETDTVTSEELASAALELTSDPAGLAGADFFVVAVPTPIDSQHRPDLGALGAAARTGGGLQKRGAMGG